MCAAGTFIREGQCTECGSVFEGCAYCTGAGCLECTPGYYLSDSGQCKKCDTLDGCVEGACSINGCTQCEEGYYLNGKECQSCKTYLKGC